MMSADPLHLTHADWIIDFLEKNRLPGMFQARENVVAGGLMSYGADLPDLFRRAAGYVQKILNGTKAADIPVEQATSFRLVINLKTAKALGITIPELLPASRQRGDRVILRPVIKSDLRTIDVRHEFAEGCGLMS